ncbi:hypothetical protein DPEC_G00150070, partial [Dallia pectoralis]
MDQREHPGLQRRSKESDNIWFWCRGVLREFAHTLPLLR